MLKWLLHRTPDPSLPDLITDDPLATLDFGHDSKRRDSNPGVGSHGLREIREIYSVSRWGILSYGLSHFEQILIHYLYFLEHLHPKGKVDLGILKVLFKKAIRNFWILILHLYKCMFEFSRKYIILFHIKIYHTQFSVFNIILHQPYVTKLLLGLLDNMDTIFVWYMWEHVYAIHWCILEILV